MLISSVITILFNFWWHTISTYNGIVYRAQLMPQWGSNLPHPDQVHYLTFPTNLLLCNVRFTILSNNDFGDIHNSYDSCAT